MSAAVDLLRAADRVLASPECWIKGVSRRDKHGKKPMLDRDAVAWCLGGALMNAMDQMPRNREDVTGANMLLHDAIRVVTGRQIHYVNYNDEPDTEFVDIKKIISTAIALGEIVDDVSVASEAEGKQLPDSPAGADTGV